jgi:transposase, IS30 family
MGAFYSHLSYSERLSIARLRQADTSCRDIARRLGRSAATVSRELRRMNWRHEPDYDACMAYFDAIDRRTKGRRGLRKLRLGTALFGQVTLWLRAGWSPLQIAGRLRLMDNTNKDSIGTVCHETIYQALYALPRGELRRELIAALRQGQATRRPRSRGKNRQSFITEAVKIAARPEDVAGRLVPGHWEGDLIKGAANRSAVATLVERTSRLVVLARMSGLDADATRCTFERAFNPIPTPLRKSLTYDRGTEMAKHATLTKNTGIAVWFCDPYSPWQRPSNENANGLIRQYLPKGIDLAPYTQHQLNIIAERLNNRPRKVLNFKTPNEVFAELAKNKSSKPKNVALQN